MEIQKNIEILEKFVEETKILKMKMAGMDIMIWN